MYKKKHYTTNRISICHTGYYPESRKIGIVGGIDEKTPQFEIVSYGAAGYRVVIEGRLKSVNSDLGRFRLADFSKLIEPGWYRVKVGYAFSLPFPVQNNTYRLPLLFACDYFSHQRCGEKTRYHEKCHFDDGIRGDNGKHLDCVGGWHLDGMPRKQPCFILPGLLGLLEAYLLLGEGFFDFSLISEAKYGNKFLLKMQDPFTGGIYPGILRSNPDDRLIIINPKEYFEGPVITYQHAASEALFYRATKKKELKYAKECLGSAQRAGECNIQYQPDNIDDFSWKAISSVELFLATDSKKCQEGIETAVSGMLQLQENKYIGNQKEVKGFFHFDTKKSGYCTLWAGLPLIALSLSFNVLANRDLKRRVLQAIKSHIDDYVKPMTGRTPFKIVPHGIFTKPPYELKSLKCWRRIGNLYYRFFFGIRQGFVSGLNPNLASYAVGLCLAAQILKDDNCLELARAQIEWILGNNPFSISYQTGVGYHNPIPYSAVGPVVGGIMIGMVGDEKDQPVKEWDSGNWPEGEYWLVTSGYLIWALALLTFMETPKRVK